MTVYLIAGDGDLLVGASVMWGLGSGNKPAGLSKIVTCEERFISLESCSRISVCTYTGV